MYVFEGIWSALLNDCLEKGVVADKLADVSPVLSYCRSERTWYKISSFLTLEPAFSFNNWNIATHTGDLLDKLRKQDLKSIVLSLQSQLEDKVKTFLEEHVNLMSKFQSWL